MELAPWYPDGKGGQPMEPSKIVVRYLDGKVLKGTTQNFFPNKPTFHVLPNHPQTSKEPMEISVSDLKAIFFVRDFLGNKLYRERKRLSSDEKPQGRLIEVTCKDGEVIVGSTTGYDPKRPGFIIFPVDPKENNLKAYIVSNAVSKVRYL
jgi:hypothetical protein